MSWFISIVRFRPMNGGILVKLRGKGSDQWRSCDSGMGKRFPRKTTTPSQSLLLGPSLRLAKNIKKGPKNCIFGTNSFFGQNFDQ